MKNSKTRTIAYLAMYVALYVVLKFVGNLIPFLQMPNGGSIEIELIAVFLCSYHLGWKLGIVDALLSWLITVIFGFTMYFVQPIQVLLDYVLPLLACGMASLLWPKGEMHKGGASVIGIILALSAYFGITKSWGTTASKIVGVIVGAAVLILAIKFIPMQKNFGIVISMLLKYLFQTLSGVYFWFPEGSAAGSAAAWTFSLAYNLWYNLVTLIVCIIIVPMIIDRLKKGGVKFAA